MKVGDIVVCTNDLNSNGEWPSQYLGKLCEVIKIFKDNTVCVKAISSELILYRITKGATDMVFHAEFLDFYNLKNISLNNLLLKLVINA